MNDLITTTTSVTTAVRNVYEIVKELIILRRNHQQLTLSRIRVLKEAADRAISLARMKGIHELETAGHDYLKDSLEQIEKYRNTELGDIFLESLRNEWEYYQTICRQYLRLTGGEV